ncbi:ATP-binding protein [Pseudoclavibacter sp. JSM 162008]|uniref:ATP-binding protein n=1 Tax=Pseudoclavibacter sp. JSM 162008 TaxID=3229855 RepID=UPI0035246318
MRTDTASHPQMKEPHAHVYCIPRPADHAPLFSRFSSGRPLGNGTGIGLFISQQFVELQGGRIHVDTISGKGTTMMFTLPLADPSLRRRRR